MTNTEFSAISISSQNIRYTLLQGIQTLKRSGYLSYFLFFRRFKLTYVLSYLIFFTLFPSHLEAQTSSTTGFIKQQFNFQTTEPYKLFDSQLRARITLSNNLNNGSIKLSGDLTTQLAGPIDTVNIIPREAYFEYYFTNGDLRIGRQIVSWGRTDASFLTDILSPVDLRSFLTKDQRDLKRGVDAINYIHYFDRHYLQAIVNPIPQAFKVPSYDSRWFPQDLVPEQIPVYYQQESSPPSLDDIQAALRFAYRPNLTYELELGVMYWQNPLPSYYKSIGTQQTGPIDFPNGLKLSERYLQSLIGTVSGLYRLTDQLILNGEAVFYKQKQFDYLTPSLRNLDFNSLDISQLIQAIQDINAGNNGFLKTKPWLGAMIGTQFNISGFTTRLQYIGEYIFNYDEDILQEEFFDYASLTLQKSFLRDRLDLLLISRANRIKFNYWINPELTYNISDSFNLSIGGHYFGGKAPKNFWGHLSFNSYQKNNLIYLKTTANF